MTQYMLSVHHVEGEELPKLVVVIIGYTLAGIYIIADAPSSAQVRCRLLGKR